MVHQNYEKEKKPSEFFEDFLSLLLVQV